jgi:hypothetical protein
MRWRDYPINIDVGYNSNIIVLRSYIEAAYNIHILNLKELLSAASAHS